MISIFGVWRSTRANYKSWKFSNPIISQILKLGFLAFDVEYFKIRISHFVKKNTARRGNCFETKFSCQNNRIYVAKLQPYNIFDSLFCFLSYWIIDGSMNC